MRKLFAAICILWVACTAFAQNRPFNSPPGQVPQEVRSGKATRAGRFNQQQMLRLAFGLRPPNLAAEEEFLRLLQTPGTPQFRRFLTADQWNARFAPSVQDEQAVVDWAQSQGLTVTQRYSNRLIVDVEGRAGVIEQALQVTLNDYLFEGDTYFSNASDPVIPAALANIIRSVSGLHNFSNQRPAGFHEKQ